MSLQASAGTSLPFELDVTAVDRSNVSITITLPILGKRQVLVTPVVALSIASELQRAVETCQRR